ncbi:HAD-IIIC family phosphatase [Acidocella aminolytica]|nr:HAD-IIIC family phosphatase [Acidocella aminolytica]GBQ38978.1 HAD family phosphatase [Acidocella aminolytica 101 = DSM 11237]
MQNDDCDFATENCLNEAQLRMAITADPQKTGLRLELARLLMAKEAWAEAEQEALVALARTPRDPVACYTTTIARTRAGSLDEAEALAVLLPLLDTQDALPDWHAEIAILLFKVGNLPEALRCINRAIAVKPNWQRFYIEKAEILYRLRDFVALSLTLQEAHRLGPLSPHYDHLLSNALEATGGLDEALAACERALEGGTSFHYHFTHAGLLSRLGRPSEALASCEHAMPLAGGLMPALQKRIDEIKARLSHKPAEAVRLVIWDLDETFWHGTLTEGGATIIPEHVELLKTLSTRGIVNAVCSKNDPEAAECKLRECGAWDYIVFPRIAFAPKGQLIADIIDTVQLRAASVLFIDDNPMNLHEAQHYNPGLQVAGADILPGLGADPRLTGKPDPNMVRLARYKLLEQKNSEQRQAGDNLAFLRQSQVRVSFHYDIAEEFPRIHELVNRTNQLNFTKRRWPENENEARATMAGEMKERFETHAAYVKVADRYGSYGICGFFMVQEHVARHFLFSCRAMNMGVEQFVWARLGKPLVPTNGEVSTSLEGGIPDWINVVDDADHESEVERDVTKPLICVRGACDLSMMTHYLRPKFDMIEEFPYPYQGWAIQPVARAVALERELDTSEGRDLLTRIPGLPRERFKTVINSLVADAYVLSFSPELQAALHRSRSTGLLMTFKCSGAPDRDFSETSYERIREIQGREPSFSAAEWTFMQEEFAFAGLLDMAQLERDATSMFETLRGKTVIVLRLNTSVGQKCWALEWFGRINEVIIPLAEQFGFTVIDLADFVRGPEDLDSPEDIGVHFSRDVYRRLANRIEAICAASTPYG